MTKDEAIRLIEDALNVDAGTLKGDEVLEEVEWNSLASVSFIALVDEQLGREIDAKVVAACRTVGELVALLVTPS